MKNTLLFLATVFIISHVMATELTIVYTHNTNGHLENCVWPSRPYGALEKRATVIDSIRKVEINLLLIDAGDILGAWINPRRHKYIAEAYKYHNYDIWTPGDQDFVEGKKFFLESLLPQLVTSHWNIDINHPNRSPRKSRFMAQIFSFMP